MFYFTYGSNLLPLRLKERIKSFKIINPCFLAKYRLAFNIIGSDGSAKANIVPNDTEMVCGALYELDESQFDELDKYEVGYTRTKIRINYAGKDLEAITYMAPKNHPEAQPYSWYLALILNGYKYHNLSPEHFEELKKIDTIIDQDKIRHETNMLIIENNPL